MGVELVVEMESNEKIGVNLVFGLLRVHCNSSLSFAYHCLAQFFYT